MRAKEVAGIEGSVGLGVGISEGVRTGFTGMSLAGGMRFIGGVGWVLCVCVDVWMEKNAEVPRRALGLRWLERAGRARRPGKSRTGYGRLAVETARSGGGRSR